MIGSSAPGDSRPEVAGRGHPAGRRLQRPQGGLSFRHATSRRFVSTISSSIMLFPIDRFLLIAEIIRKRLLKKDRQARRASPEE